MIETLTLLRSFFPPDLSVGYLHALGGPLFETLSLVLGAMTVVFLVSLPLGVAVGSQLRGASWLLHALTALRAVPELTLAILCVILFGIGPGAGLMALILYYTAAVAKVFADLLSTAPHRPLETLSATGALRVQVALYGLLPLTRSALLSYGAFAFECAVRAAVIVGAVGGGGLGAELIGSLAAYDLQHAATVILLLVIVIALLDRAARWLRDRPRWLALLLPFGLAAAWYNAPAFFAFDHALRVFADMFPPTLDRAALGRLPQYVGETLYMALASTLCAGVCAMPAALAISQSSPVWLRFPLRRVFELLRTIPEVVWALVLMAAVGVGPAAGVWALGLHSFGSLARLFADSLDNAPVEPRDAMASTGASRIVVAGYATIPLALGSIATHMLFRLEWNMRMATVLGLIGAGGLGQALYEAQQLFFYRQAFAYMLVTAVLILVTDSLGGRLRARLRNIAPNLKGQRIACLVPVAGEWSEVAPKRSR